MGQMRMHDEWTAQPMIDGAQISDSFLEPDFLDIHRQELALNSSKRRRGGRDPAGPSSEVVYELRAALHREDSGTEVVLLEEGTEGEKE